MNEQSALSAAIAVPVVTRVQIILATILALATACKLVSPAALMWDLRAVLFKLQLHRLITSSFYPGSLLNTLYSNFYLLNLSSSLEQNTIHFPQRGSYLWFITIMLLSSVFFASLLHRSSLLFLFPVYRAALGMIWSRINSHSYLSFYGLKVPAMYVPLAILSSDLLFGESLTSSLAGLTAGAFLWQLKSHRSVQNIFKTPLAISYIHNQLDRVSILILETTFSLTASVGKTASSLFSRPMQNVAKNYKFAGKGRRLND